MGSTAEAAEKFPTEAGAAPVPNSFWGYLKSLGPGVVAGLTWLGAGDIVNSATAGGNYGYALMWAFALSLLIRYLFVSIIAKYQLSNERGENVLAGLARLHPFYAWYVFVAALLTGHAVGIYTLAGIGLAGSRLTGLDAVRLWALGVALVTFSIAFRGKYRLLEKIFFVLVGLLSLSLIGVAVLARPSPLGIARGIFGFAVPPTVGRFDAIFIMVAFVGAVGGSLGNFMYPYFTQAKGWVSPVYRRVQQYDLLFGILVLIILDLSIWVVGAEVLHPKGLRIAGIDDLARLLGETLGQFGTNLFYLGILAALFGSMLGNGTAYAYLASDAYFQMRSAAFRARHGDHKNHSVYRWSVACTMLSPLIWIMRGQLDFVGLTLLLNAAQVLLIPVLVAGIWVITARARYIGAHYKNKWWENVFVGFLLLLGLISMYFSLSSLMPKVRMALG